MTSAEKTENVLSGRIARISFRGRHQLVEMQFTAPTEKISLRFELASDFTDMGDGSDVVIQLDPKELMVLEQR